MEDQRIPIMSMLAGVGHGLNNSFQWHRIPSSSVHFREVGTYSNEVGIVHSPGDILGLV